RHVGLAAGGGRGADGLLEAPFRALDVAQQEEDPAEVVEDARRAQEVASAPAELERLLGVVAREQPLLLALRHERRLDERPRLQVLVAERLGELEGALRV